MIATEYGIRLDNQPVSRSATVDDVPDFVNLYDYDAEGNRTRRIEIATGEVTEYHWDHRNRLVGVSTRTTDNGPLTTDTQYAYDYLNRWIARSYDPDGDGPLGFTDTYFVYDGTPPSGSLLHRAAVTMENIGQIVLHFETDAQGDPQLAHRYLWGPAVDQILADEQVTDPTAPGNIVWPLTDHLNTVRDLAIYDADTDATTIVNHLIYDAYGRITSQSNPDQTTLFAFTARPLDPATGLQNNLNRWYDAEVGRWLSEDPIGFAASDANLYQYVGNTPPAAIDPLGLAGSGKDLHHHGAGGLSIGGGFGPPRGHYGGGIFRAPWSTPGQPRIRPSTQTPPAPPAKATPNPAAKAPPAPPAKPTPNPAAKAPTNPAAKAPTAPKGMKFPGSDATKAPDGFVWRGKPGSKPGSKDGNYYNLKTGESLRPDLNHAHPPGPDWDYRDRDGKWW